MPPLAREGRVDPRERLDDRDRTADRGQRDDPVRVVHGGAERDRGAAVVTGNGEALAARARLDARRRRRARSARSSLEVARPAELAPLIADAYGFTDTERPRHRAGGARGCPTKKIAGRLHVTTYTVQDHLKSVFAKSGACSRGELVARLFFDHYAPRMPAPDGPSL